MTRKCTTNTIDTYATTNQAIQDTTPPSRSEGYDAVTRLEVRAIATEILRLACDAEAKQTDSSGECEDTIRAIDRVARDAADHFLPYPRLIGTFQTLAREVDAYLSGVKRWPAGAKMMLELWSVPLLASALIEWVDGGTDNGHRV